MPEEKITSWEELEKYDQIIRPEEREIIDFLRRQNPQQCPDLRRDGEFFYFCGKGLPKALKPKLSPGDPMYQGRVSVEELQLHCMDNFEACCFYNESLKK